MTEQVHEFEMLVHDLDESGMVLLEKFRVMSVIEKLPKSWEEFALSQKRQKGEITWTNLMLDISVNVVTVRKKRKVVTKKANTKPDKNKAKRPKANKPCWSCGQVGHWSKDCPSKKAKKAGVVAQANTVLGLGTMNGPVANMVIGEVVASGTDDSLFRSYQQSHGMTVTMGNASVAQVLGIGNEDLKSASGRILSLTRVHHVPSIRRNIISGSCLVKNGFELSLKCNKIVITHTGTFFGKGYLPDESSDLWHLRLGHLNHGALKNMLNLELIPKVPLKHMDKTPYELWRKRRTSLNYLRVWGCVAKVLFPEHKRKKLGPKTVDCIFLGYLETTTAMRFLVLKSNIDGIVAKTIVEFRDATFFEEVFPMKTSISLGSSEDDPTHTSSSIPDHVEKMTNVGADPGSSSTPNKVEEPRRSKRAKVVKDFGSDFITYNVEDEPLTFRQAKDYSESRNWKGAVKSEIDSIVSNGTWELVDLPPGCSTIGCKWIFKRKLNPDGSINKYMARLVAKGFRQREGIDYFDTYSPVARMTTIRMLIALASVHGLIIHQMDLKTDFLHGDLKEEINMDQPVGFVASDDILLFGTNIEIINETKSFLKMHFEMKDMGKASVILGIKLTQSTDGITLSQFHYLEKSILEKYGYSNYRIASTPYDSKVALVKNNSGVPVSQLRLILAEILDNCVWVEFKD
ncbi:hypothetical protein AgCh_026508 [Apium graveolens]